MTWAAPLAAWLALAATLPILAHLWSRRRPATLPFPTLRFLREAAPVARRPRRIHEWPLLLLRLAIVAAVVVAAAGPTLVTANRLEAARQQLHRVVLIDHSAARHADAVTTEARQGAASVAVFGPGDVSAWLGSAIAHGQRAAAQHRVEIVVAWDGSRYAVAPDDLRRVPASLGLALHVVPATDGRREPANDGTIDIAAAPADVASREALLARTERWRLVAPSRRVLVTWPGARVATPADVEGGDATAAQQALDTIADDLRVREAAWRSTRDARAIDGIPPAARVLARAADGQALLEGWPTAGGLHLALHATPDSPLALWSLLAASEAQSPPARWPVSPAAALAWSAEDLRSTERPAPLPTTPTLPGGLDTPIAWGVALVLLLIEQAWRRGRDADGSDHDLRDTAPATDGGRRDAA